MGLVPQLPLGGIAGWRLLERIEPSQRAAFEKGPALARELAHFEASIDGITTAAELVADHRLLKVALGAFGLEGEIDKRAFIRKVLEDGTGDPKALAVRLSDPAFRKLSDAFGFGDAAGARTGEPGFAARITAAYKTRAYEAALGETNEDMRLALNFRREIAELAGQGETGGSWFSVLGSKPLRAVVEKALGLPAAFGRLDVDRQRDVMRDKAAALLGSPDLAAFRDPANVEKVIVRFLARSQIEGGVSAGAPGSAALTLLRGMTGNGSQGLLNLLASRG